MSCAKIHALIKLLCLILGVYILVASFMFMCMFCVYYDEDEQNMILMFLVIKRPFRYY